MPVIATPITSPSTGIQCADLQVIGPRITQLYGINLPTKRRALIASQGQTAVLELQLTDRNGNAVNLTGCGIVDGNEDAAQIKIRECINTNATVYTVAATIITADEGTLEIALPTTVTRNPGVYFLEAAILDEDDTIAFSNQFYLWIDRGLFGDPQYPHAGPPNLDDIRMALRDNAPEENRLLDDFEYDLAEVCHATEYMCRYWNEAQPPINIGFNTITYPARDHWLKGICGYLLVIAAHRFRRNHLPYQAGGIAVDDQNKFQQYEVSGQLLIREYKEWVKNKKVQINCQMAMTTSGSRYGNMNIWPSVGI